MGDSSNAHPEPESWESREATERARSLGDAWELLDGRAPKKPKVELAPAVDEGQKHVQISRQVDLLNKKGVLKDTISYPNVQDIIEQCELNTALKILRDLESFAGVVENPTEYVI